MAMGRLARSGAMITQRPTIGSLRSSGIAKILGYSFSVRVGHADAKRLFQTRVRPFPPSPRESGGRGAGGGGALNPVSTQAFGRDTTPLTPTLSPRSTGGRRRNY